VHHCGFCALIALGCGGRPESPRIHWNDAHAERAASQSSSDRRNASVHPVFSAQLRTLGAPVHRGNGGKLGSEPPRRLSINRTNQIFGSRERSSKRAGDWWHNRRTERRELFSETFQSATAANNVQTVTAAHRPSPAFTRPLAGVKGPAGPGAVKEMGGTNGDYVISGQRLSTSGLTSNTDTGRRRSGYFHPVPPPPPGHFSLQLAPHETLKNSLCQLWLVLESDALLGLLHFIAGPAVWNSLPDHLRDPAVDSEQFRRKLKTYLFAGHSKRYRIRGVT